MLRIAVIAGLLVGTLAGLAGGADADADGPRPGDPLRLDVAVGETVERDVGFALGLLCDDLSIARADLRASTPESNTFRVTGVQEGTTRCRVGTAPARPTYLFEIHVVAARRRR